MRFILVLSFLFGVSNTMAQGLQTLLRGAPKKVSVGGMSVRVVQGKMLPSPIKMVSYNSQTEQIRRLLVRQIQANTWNHLPYTNPHVSVVGIKTGLKLYRETLANFENLRKELNPVLLYQSNPRERRVLTAHEKREILEKINRVHGNLKQVSAYISLTEPNLQIVREYVEEARCFLVPEVGKMPFTKPLPRTDRVFQVDEFFLRDPKISTLKKMSQWITPTKNLASLRLAVLNDEHEITFALRNAHQHRLFVPDGQLFLYSDPEKFVEDIQSGRCKPNFILTDLSLPRSSGYLVTEQLRKAGYTGPIVGFAAFQEHTELAREMFDYGLDGMISASKIFYQKPFWQDRIHHKISNYIYYQQLHHWEHSYTEKFESEP